MVINLGKYSIRLYVCNIPMVLKTFERFACFPLVAFGLAVIASPKAARDKHQTFSKVFKRFYQIFSYFLT